MPTTVLLTGVTGFVGSEILYELLLHTPAQVTCLIRAHDDEEAEERLRAIVERMLGEDGWDTVRRRVSAVRGDITAPRLGLRPWDVSRIVAMTTHIIHGAASVRFGLRLNDARAINLRGTLSMLTLAAACARHGRLERFGYVSTAYVAGRHSGVFGEDDLDVGQSFRNTYERTKFEAEQMVRWRMDELPVTVLRPSIVVGDSATGATRGFNVVYWPLRLYADGVLRFAPAASDLPVDLVPVDFVARGVVEGVLGAGRAGATYALAAGRHATDAHAIADLASGVFDVPPPTMFSTPLDRVLWTVATRLAVVGPFRRYARPLREYLPYFLEGSRFDAGHADSLLRPRGLGAPSIDEFLLPVLEFARETDFGRDREAIARREQECSAARLAAVQAAMRRRHHAAQPVGRSRRREPVLVGRAS